MTAMERSLWLVLVMVMWAMDCGCFNENESCSVYIPR